jgi:hypothetical protein
MAGKRAIMKRLNNRPPMFSTFKKACVSSSALSSAFFIQSSTPEAHSGKCIWLFSSPVKLITGSAKNMSAITRRDERGVTFPVEEQVTGYAVVEH